MLILTIFLVLAALFLGTSLIADFSLLGVLFLAYVMQSKIIYGPSKIDFIDSLMF
jgi:hypothetical protein